MGMGTISLIFGLLALLVGWLIMLFVPYGNYIMYALCGLAIVFGIIGIIKDDSKGKAIAGMILGIIALIVWPILWTVIAVILFAGLMGGLI